MNMTRDLSRGSVPVLIRRLSLFMVVVFGAFGFSGCFLFQSPPEEPEKQEWLLQQAENGVPACIDVTVSDTKGPNHLKVSVLLKNNCQHAHTFAIRPIYRSENGERVWPEEADKSGRTIRIRPGDTKVYENSVSSDRVYEVEGVEFNSVEEQ